MSMDPHPSPATQRSLFSLGVTFRRVDVTHRLARAEGLLARACMTAQLAERVLSDAEERLRRASFALGTTSTQEAGTPQSCA